MGQCAWWSTAWVTEPSIMIECGPPWPCDPTTSSSAPEEAARDTVFAMTRLKHELETDLARAGFIDRLGPGRVFATLPTAAAAFAQWCSVAPGAVAAARHRAPGEVTREVGTFGGGLFSARAYAHAHGRLTAVR
jgi:hypothetical protein